MDMFGRGVKRGRIKASELPGRPGISSECGSLAEVAAKVEELRADLDKALDEARKWFT